MWPPWNGCGTYTLALDPISPHPGRRYPRCGVLFCFSLLLHAVVGDSRTAAPAKAIPANTALWSEPA